MSKRCIGFLLTLLLIFLLSSCKEDYNTYNNNEPTKVISEIKADDPEEKKEEIISDFQIVGVENGITINNNIYTITLPGEYTLSGNLNNGEVIVDAGEEDEVFLLLSKCIISSSADSPIKILSSKEVTIKAIEDTYNEINDTRPVKTEDNEELGSAAIYSTCDLKIQGKGNLVVTSTYNNGIHTKDDLKIKNINLKVTAINNALKGNDSVEIESGNLILISTGGDGIKTENSDVSNKGNQKGNVNILGGVINIYAACDGIDSSYNVSIETGTSLSIKTSKYSDYSDEVVSTSETEMYLILPTSIYKSSYKYKAYFYNDDSSNGKFVDCTYETMVYSGRTSYYALKLSAPSNQNVIFYIFESDTTDTSNYKYKTSSIVVNTSMNACLLSTSSGSELDYDWVNLTTSSGGQGRGPGGMPGGMGEGNTDKSEYSSKGIKSANEIIVNDGIISIEANDDGLHSSYGETLENGETSIGNVTINGGEIEISSSDDGIHADNTLTINDGYINVVTSYEGLEANTVIINGGSSYVYAKDDGLNAKSGKTTPSIKVTGGYLDVTTASGDTDGIDSNGSYTQSGGVVLIKGGSSSGQVSGSLDTDGKVRVTGGLIIAIGGICELPESSKPYVKMQRKSISSGNYKLEVDGGETIFEFTISGSYSGIWICSDKFSIGSSYKLTKDGSSFISWKQSTSSQTIS